MPDIPTPQHQRFEDGLLVRFFSGAALEKARHYARDGKVRDIEVSANGNLITAMTEGSADSLYHQRITVRYGPTGQMRVDGSCTCPMQQNCKHVAAVLMTLRRRGPGPAPPRPAQQLPPAPRPTFSPPPPPPPPSPPAPPPEPELPYAVAEWLRGLRDAGDDESPDAYPPKVRMRLFYVLEPVATVRLAMKLAVLSATLRKDNTPGAPRTFSPHQVNNGAAYVRPSDRLILHRLGMDAYGTGDLARDDDPPDLLRRAIATGRARWGGLDGPALYEGPPRPGRIAWELLFSGEQQPVLLLEDGLLGFRLPGPWYADPASGAVGPVETGLPAGLAARLLAAPPVPAQAAPKVAAAIAERLPGRALPVPQQLGPPEILRGTPVPHLRLTTISLPGYGTPDDPQAVPVARLRFRYGPIEIPSGERLRPVQEMHAGRLYRVQRDAGVETEAARWLEYLGFRRIFPAPAGTTDPTRGDVFGLAAATGGGDWLDVLLRDVPALRSEGWVVTIDDSFPMRLLEAEGEIEAEVSEGSGIDWFELHLGVMVGGERVDLVPALLRLLPAIAPGTLPADDEMPCVLPFEDGRLVKLPFGRIRPIVEALIELHGQGGIAPEAETLGFNRLDAADLALLEERSGIVWRGADAVRALGRQLRAAGGAIPPAQMPAAFRGRLRPYQAEGVGWLQFLRSADLGGVLADDMGLGKTVQTLAHLAIEHEEGRLDRPALIVCPTSLVPNWSMEAARFAPHLKLLALHGPARKARFDAIAAHDIVLTTYPLLTRDHAVLTAQEWHVVVLDEAQTIKNPNAETTRQALRLRARQRLCLSGTPLQNHLGELWSLFDFLAPGFLGSAQGFRAQYRTPIEKRGDAARQGALARRIRPFLLRRTKEQVVQELPPKTEIAEPVELEEAQRAIYESVRLAMHAKVRAAIAEQGLARSGIIILDALLKLRQVCCDPRLLKLEAARRGRAGSAKLERLMEMLETMRAEDRRVLVFSQFTSMLALIEERLRAAGITYGLLTGDTKDRATPVAQFQAGRLPVFLVSLKAGGLGLNLTAADTVIHYDPWWNPAVEDQATDRAHRIGQDKRVFVHRLVALGTIEEKMETLKERKRALVQAVLGADGGAALKLTEADVEELFAPA